MTADPPGRSFFLGLIGTPYHSDLLTTTLRLATEAVRQAHEVTVWTCGYATSLTVRPLGQHKPRNVVDWERRYDSTAATIARVLDSCGDRMQWLVCRFCMQERGAVEQMDGVRVRPSYEFVQRALAADVSLVLGEK